MTHNQVLDIFKKCYPIEDDMVLCWFPNGKNSVRIRFANKVELVFTYKSSKEWTIETRDAFINRINNEK